MVAAGLGPSGRVAHRAERRSTAGGGPGRVRGRGRGCSARSARRRRSRRSRCGPPVERVVVRDTPERAAGAPRRRARPARRRATSRSIETSSGRALGRGRARRRRRPDPCGSPTALAELEARQPEHMPEPDLDRIRALAELLERSAADVSDDPRHRDEREDDDRPRSRPRSRARTGSPPACSPRRTCRR